MNKNLAELPIYILILAVFIFITRIIGTFISNIKKEDYQKHSYPWTKEAWTSEHWVGIMLSVQIAVVL